MLARNYSVIALPDIMIEGDDIKDRSREERFIHWGMEVHLEASTKSVTKNAIVNVEVSAKNTIKCRW